MVTEFLHLSKSIEKTIEEGKKKNYPLSTVILNPVKMDQCLSPFMREQVSFSFFHKTEIKLDEVTL